MDTIVGLSVGLVLVGLAVVADLNNMLDNNEASSGGSTCTGGADPTFPPYFTSTVSTNYYYCSLTYPVHIMAKHTACLLYTSRCV